MIILPPRPTTYTPFFKRFRNARAADLKEVRNLYEAVASYERINQVSARSITGDILDGVYVPEGLNDPFRDLIYGLVSLEDVLAPIAEPAFERMSLEDLVAYRNTLNSKYHYHQNSQQYLMAIHDCIAKVARGLSNLLPETEAPSPFTVPLWNCFPYLKETIEAIFDTMFTYYKEGIVNTTARRMYINLCNASGQDIADPNTSKMVYPENSELPPEKLVREYLGGTPFFDFFAQRVPLRLSHEDRFNHTHVLGGSGSGKTTLIENLIRYDISQGQPVSLVLIDPHSDLVRKLVRSNLGNQRVILLDPRDIQHPLALNPLAVNQARLEQYDESTREQVTAGVIQTFGYLWGGLTNLALTGKQDVLFRYVARLLLSFPSTMGRNATILDMLELMRDPTPYKDAIEQLPPIPRDFFQRDFVAQKTFDQTREQIRYRIQSIIENPTMARLFTAPETKVDLFTEMNQGSIILIDTAKDFLKEMSAIFGKLMISLILQAIMERAAIPEYERMPTFIMIDEASTFFSTNIDDLLTEARKYKAGLLLGHQYLEQASGGLRASLAANTGIKFASGISASDANAMARDMATDSAFIMQQPRLQFATHIRGATPSAVSIPIEPVNDYERLSDHEFDRFIAQNRLNVSAGVIEPVYRERPTPALPPPPEAPRRPPPKTTKAPLPDIDGEWV